MSRLRKLVSALMILAVVTMLNAPLFACQMAGHRCAMMLHAKQVSPLAKVAKAEHACCPKKGKQAPSEQKQSCHQGPATLPSDSASPMNCCSMGNTPGAASVPPSVPTTKLMLIAISGPFSGILSAVEKHAISLAPTPPNSRAVLDLKTDLRI